MMKKGWKEFKFTNFVEINPKIKLNKEELYDFVEMADVNPNYRHVYSKQKKLVKGGSKFESGDILFARITPCLEHGKITQFVSNSKKPAFGSTEFYVFREKQGVSNQGFIYYLSRSELIRKPAEKSMVGASGRQRAQIDAIKDITITAPNLTEQQKIATILSNYDNLIENNTKRIKLLEKIAKLIYDEWFVKFKFPGHEKIKLVDSELGKIPERWEVGNFEDLTEITSSKRIYSREYVENGVQFYRSREIIQKFNHDTIKTKLFISKEKYEKIKEKFGVPKKGDILITSVGTLGIPYLVSNDDQFYFKDGNLIWLKDIYKNYSTYIYYWLISDDGKQSLLSTSIGTSQAAFTITNLKKIKIIKPLTPMLIEFEKIVGTIRKNIELIEIKNQNLSRTRDLLLPRLITGKVDVSELDIQVEVEA